MEQPAKNARLSSARVVELLRTLYGAQALRFVDKTGIDFGLAEPAVQVTVWEANEAIGKKLLFGKPVADVGGEVYARTGEGESVYVVESALWMPSA